MLQKIKILLLVMVLATFFPIVVIQFTYAQGSPASYTLMAGPKTIHWGYYSSKVESVLKINSGDIVTIRSTSGNPSLFENLGVPPDKIPQELRDIQSIKDRGPGPHRLTGPIYINGAEPGDMLEVHIKDVKIPLEFGFNMNVWGAGTLPEDFPYTSAKLLIMDRERMTSEVFPGVVIPLRPFFGSMGVAPNLEQGRISSEPPGIHGGNLDNKELIAGTILYLPIFVKGALFSAGDGHAAQGDGEVNVCGLETELTGTFQFFVRKNKRIIWPRAETPTYFITMGLDEDLDVAAKIAVREMINYLHEEKGISRGDAYMLTSLAVDLHVTQLVDRVKGIHAMLPKSIFVKK